MPVNERYPLRDVLEACRAFFARRRRRVFVEFVMLDGVNDRYEQALALADALRAAARAMFKVNLIPYNPTSAAYAGSGRASIAAFRAALEARGVPVTVRLTRGREISAACGSSRRRRRVRSRRPSAPAPVGARAPSRPDSSPPNSSRLLVGNHHAEALPAADVRGLCPDLVTAGALLRRVQAGRFRPARGSRDQRLG